MLTYNERLSFLMRKNQGRLDMPKYIKELGSLVRDDLRSNRTGSV